ncbi:MAG TPA: UDP-N-acetylmuramoyl-L-alanyl-D-glutamate--2,6-diaminopimelate ligase [Oscillospiraceae bacterium]|nr:UDP-N-acetylmuramoyl-L-alanyl-D-glutamate--2,6-diaminopimelate ligase [Oscillospiraceae bacterium]
MLLSELLRDVNYTGTIQDMEIKAVTCDSRLVEPGSVFVCIKGGAVDGHEYARAAKRLGASWIIAERDTGLANQVLVEDARAAYAVCCANINGRPADKLRLIGVTGTNGKTTITYLIKHILESAGKKTGLIGTIHNEIGDMELPAKHTTPDPAELHILFRRMVEAGCEYCVMEVSSHALDQHRVEGCRFETAIFTNLTQDHLDYHGTMENYFAAKSLLFGLCDKAVVCIDDEYGRRLAASVQCPVTTVSIHNDEADFTAHEIHLSATGCKYMLVGNGLIGRISFAMPGDFSVMNSMMAACAALNAGIPFDQTVEALNSSAGVSGRAEVIPTGRDFTVICDYAHDPDALEKILESVCAYKGESRLVTLFGCAGQRDKTKRPKMAKIVADHSDFFILTSDNPRNESPQEIIDEALEGLEGTQTPYHVEADRYKAIKWALENSRPGDILLLAGKGHEDYQVLDYGTIYFDERVVVKDLLARMDSEKGIGAVRTADAGNSEDSTNSAAPVETDASAKPADSEK